MNGHRSSSNNLDNLPLPVAIHTKSHQLPINSCWKYLYSITYPTNTNHITCCHIELAYQCILTSIDTALVLTSDDIHSFPSSPPFLPPFLLHIHSGSTLYSSHMLLSLLCVYIRLLSFDLERHLWSTRCFSSASICLCASFIQRPLHFFGTSFLFLFQFFCVTRTSVFFFPHGL